MKKPIAYDPCRTVMLTGIFFVAMGSVSLAQKCDSTAADKLHETYPDYTFQSVNPTPISGVCEVVSDKNTIYFVPDSGHLIFGEIWSKDGKNITADKQEKRIASTLDSLPLGKAVKLGNGPNTVIEITDPDCPFCRKGSEFFKYRTDVTRYIFFNPLDRLHPNAARKAKYILSAENMPTAYKQVMSGKFDHAPLPSFTPNGLLAEHRKIAASLQASSTPKYWINGHLVSGFNTEKIKKLLNTSQASGAN